MNISRLSVPEIFALYASIMEVLRDRKVIRSSNNPAGDYAEYLFCKAFGWKRLGKVEEGADAIGRNGVRYQIKGRRLTRHNKSRQLSAIRRLPEGNFDILAGVLFNEDFSILRAATIPHTLVVKHSDRVEATNSWRFLLRDEVWGWSGVRDVTARVKTAVSR